MSATSLSTVEHSALLDVLDNIRGSGSFCVSGSLPFVFPGIRLPDGEAMAFPLVKSQAQAIAAIAEAAPFGKGEETVYDESVRKCRQLDAAELDWSEAEDWQHILDGIVAIVRNELGIPGKISAQAYKLLLYETGGFFLPHRDTEKLGNMFGSLIIALPSKHRGGHLRVRHDGREKVVDFSGADGLRRIQYAAFFADCEHEVEPVAAGNRLCLAYNLVLEKGDPTELNPTLSAQANSLIPTLEAMRQKVRDKSTNRPDDDNHERDNGKEDHESLGLMAFTLGHRYTKENLSFAALKNDDRARAGALVSAAEAAGYTAHLCLLTLHQMGTLEDDDRDYGYRRRRYYDCDDDGDDDYDDSSHGTMGEIFDEELYLEGWRDVGDDEAALGCFSIAPENIVCREPLGSGDPDQKESEGYTGNAGCTMDYWYHRAAVVLWPAENDAEIRVDYDFGGACRQLRHLADKDGAAASQSASYQTLASAALRNAVERLNSAADGWDRHQHSEDSRPLLEAIALAADRELLSDCRGDGLLDDWLEHGGNELWQNVIAAFGSASLIDVIDRFLDGGNERFAIPLVHALGALLASDADCGDEAGSAAIQVVAAKLPVLLKSADRKSSGTVSDHDFRYQYRYYARRSLPLPESLVRRPADQARIVRHHIAIAASRYIDDNNTGDREVLFRFLAGSSLDHLRDVLAPALQAETHRRHFTDRRSLHSDLLANAIRRLKKEIAEPLEPYADQTRPFPTKHSGKAGPLIAELERFLVDPIADRHSFKRNESDRQFLQAFIARHQLDLETETERKGRPYTLICTKTDASYRRAVKRRKEDEMLLEKLDS